MLSGNSESWTLKTCLDDSTRPGISKGRIESLTDGIFATVMTVLVLSLSVPVLTGSLTSAQVNRGISSIEGLFPTMLSHLLSFLILSVMWWGHHGIFDCIPKLNRHLVWLNMVYLLCVGFIPFSTALLGRYPLTQVAVIMYGLNMIACSGIIEFFVYYSVREKMIAAEDGFKAITKRVSPWTGGIFVYILAVIFSFIDTRISIAIYLLSLIYYGASGSFRTSEKK